MAKTANFVLNTTKIQGLSEERCIKLLKLSKARDLAKLAKEWGLFKLQNGALNNSTLKRLQAELTEALQAQLVEAKKVKTTAEVVEEQVKTEEAEVSVVGTEANNEEPTEGSNSTPDEGEEGEAMKVNAEQKGQKAEAPAEQAGNTQNILTPEQAKELTGIAFEGITRNQGRLFQRAFGMPVTWKDAHPNVHGGALYALLGKDVIEYLNAELAKLTKMEVAYNQEDFEIEAKTPKEKLLELSVMVQKVEDLFNTDNDRRIEFSKQVEIDLNKLAQQCNYARGFFKAALGVDEEVECVSSWLRKQYKEDPFSLLKARGETILAEGQAWLERFQAKKAEEKLQKEQEQAIKAAANKQKDKEEKMMEAQALIEAVYPTMDKELKKEHLDKAAKSFDDSTYSEWEEKFRETGEQYHLNLWKTALFAQAQRLVPNQLCPQASNKDLLGRQLSKAKAAGLETLAALTPAMMAEGAKDFALELMAEAKERQGQKENALALAQQTWGEQVNAIMNEGLNKEPFSWMTAGQRRSWVQRLSNINGSHWMTPMAEAMKEVAENFYHLGDKELYEKLVANFSELWKKNGGGVLSQTAQHFAKPKQEGKPQAQPKAKAQPKAQPKPKDWRVELVGQMAQQLGNVGEAHWLMTQLIGKPVNVRNALDLCKEIPREAQAQIRAGKAQQMKDEIKASIAADLAIKQVAAEKAAKKNDEDTDAKVANFVNNESSNQGEDTPTDIPADSGNKEDGMKPTDNQKAHQGTETTEQVVDTQNQEPQVDTTQVEPKADKDGQDADKGLRVTVEEWAKKADDFVSGYFTKLDNWLNSFKPTVDAAMKQVMLEQEAIGDKYQAFPKERKEGSTTDFMVEFFGRLSTSLSEVGSKAEGAKEGKSPNEAASFTEQANQKKKEIVRGAFQKLVADKGSRELLVNTLLATAVRNGWVHDEKTLADVWTEVMEDAAAHVEDAEAFGKWVSEKKLKGQKPKKLLSMWTKLGVKITGDKQVWDNGLEAAMEAVLAKRGEQPQLVDRWMALGHFMLGLGQRSINASVSILLASKFIDKDGNERSLSGCADKTKRTYLANALRKAMEEVKLDLRHFQMLLAPKVKSWKAVKGSVLVYWTWRPVRAMLGWIADPFRAVGHVLKSGWRLVAGHEKGRLEGAKLALKDAWECLKDFGWRKPKALVLGAWNWLKSKFTKNKDEAKVNEANEASKESSEQEEKESGMFAKMKNMLKKGWTKTSDFVKEHKAETGGAAVGAVVGGFLGGFLGALIGAAVGAAVGYVAKWAKGKWDNRKSKSEAGEGTKAQTEANTAEA